jgi:hypothetical protein
MSRSIVMRSGCLLLLPGLAQVACRSTSESQAAAPRYVVSGDAIDVGVGSGLCVAVDPLDRHGVWWWEPGGPGCGSRSTGPGVFRADQATVSQPTPSSPITLSFRLPTHSTTHPFVDVRLVVDDGGMRAVGAAAHVPIRRRNDLEVPAKR